MANESHKRILKQNATILRNLWILIAVSNVHERPDTKGLFFITNVILNWDTFGFFSILGFIITLVGSVGPGFLLQGFARPTYDKGQLTDAGTDLKAITESDLVDSQILF